MAPVSDKARNKLKEDLLTKLEEGQKQSISNEVSNTENMEWTPTDDDWANMAMKKNYENLQLKEKPLDEPLSKPVSKRIGRALAYEDVVVDSNKWEGLVQARRCAEQLKFPLENIDSRRITTFKNSQPRLKTNLQKKVHKLLYGDEGPPQKQETEAEKEQRKALCLEDAKERSREMWRARLLRERYERKAYIRNKSKGRKHHRILKKERLQREKERIEQLRDTDPAAALEAIKELDRLRIEERMTLRHKASKWLKLQGPKVTRDKNVRETIKENQRIQDELLEKIDQNNMNSDILDDLEADDNDDDEVEIKPEDLVDDEEDVEEDQAKKDEKEAELMKEFWKKIDQIKTDLKGAESNKGNKKNPPESQKKKNTTGNNQFEFMVPDFEEVDEEQRQIAAVKPPTEKQPRKPVKETPIAKEPSTNLLEDEEVENDSDEEDRAPASSFEKCLEVTEENDTEDKVDDMVENLLDETLIKDFRAAKHKEAQENKIKLPDHFIPGWNTWHGADVKKRPKKANKKGNKKKSANSKAQKQANRSRALEQKSKNSVKNTKKRGSNEFEEVPGWDDWHGPDTSKASTVKNKKIRLNWPKLAPTRKNQFGNTIYRRNSDVNPALREQMVKEVPYPFKSVADYEASVRYPLLRQTLPVAEFHNLIKPKVVTKMGQVIKPVNEDMLIKKHIQIKKREENKIKKRKLGIKNKDKTKFHK